MSSRRAGRWFLVAEFRGRDGAPVPVVALGELQDLVAELLDPLRSRFGRTTVTSGYRSAEHNAAVGGAPRSFHRYELQPGRGVAADVRCARGGPREWAAFLDSLGAGGLGTYRDFVHVDTRAARARWSG
jgi:uncharacterized protein YcbK (DUF882 family)